MVVTFRFLLLFLPSFLPSGSWIALFWLPAETLSLKRLLVSQEIRDLFLRHYTA